MFKRLEEAYDYAPLPVRLGLAALFAFTGIGKILDPAGTTQFFSNLGIPFADIAVWLAVGIELLGALFLLLGFLTRLTAFVLAVFVLTALTLAYFIPWPPQNMLLFVFHFPVLGALIGLFLSGPGKPSIDFALFWE